MREVLFLDGYFFIDAYEATMLAYRYVLPGLMNGLNWVKK